MRWGWLLALVGLAGCGLAGLGPQVTLLRAVEVEVVDWRAAVPGPRLAGLGPLWALRVVVEADRDLGAFVRETEFSLRGEG